MPPLRKRPEDIPLLAEFFLDRYRYRSPARVRGFEPKAMEMLTRQSWPGNVRELENYGPAHGRAGPGPVDQCRGHECQFTGNRAVPMKAGRWPLLAELERRHIEHTLRRFGGRKGETAKALGIDRKTPAQQDPQV